MKTLLLATLILTATSSAKQNWVDLPDGYVWESPPANQPKFSSTAVPTHLMSGKLTKAILDQWPLTTLPERLVMSEIDLNADGRREVFIGVPAYSGTGGTSFLIFSPNKDQLIYAGTVFGYGFEFLSPVKGWAQIKGYSNGGGGHHSRHLSQFGKKGYSVVRNENHNTNNRTVKITTQPREKPSSLEYHAIKDDYKAKAAVVEKLDKIILTKLNITNLSLREAISKLQKIEQQDRPKSRVINFVIRKPKIVAVDDDPFGGPPPKNNKPPKKLTLVSESLSFAKALDKLCLDAGHLWAISFDDRGLPVLVITPKLN